MANQVTGYDGTFALQLRRLMDKSPKTGRSVTQKELGEAVGVRAQTISLYINGNTQPAPDTLVKMAEFFGVSVDYLLTGISAENIDINATLGLSEDAIAMLKRAHEYDKPTGEFATPTELINDLFADKTFYEFLDDLSYKAAKLRIIQRHTAEKPKTDSEPDLEGYYIYDIQMYVQEYIRKQLVKHGLIIDTK